MSADAEPRAELRPLHAAARNPWLQWLLVSAVAAVPRLLDLEHPSLTYDELWDYRDALRFRGATSLVRPISDGYQNGQLPFFVARVLFALLGPSELLARGLSVAAGLAGLGALLLLARAILGAKGGVFAALLFALSPFGISASRLAFSHGHALPLVFLLLATHCVLRAPATGRPGPLPWVGGAALALGLAAGTDLLATLWVPSVLLGFAVRTRSAPPRARCRLLGAFCAAFLLGLGLASPMYLRHPLAALRELRGTVGDWEALRGYLWLGEVVEQLPATYFLVVAVAKISWPVLALACAGVARALLAPRRAPVGLHLLLLCCWPLALLSLKSLLSPYYASMFVPVVCVFAAYGLGGIAAASGSRLSPRVAALASAAVAAIAVSTQVYTIARIHPDYLMLGVQYGERMVGEFQGPAVSHGQWMGEALEYVRSRSPDRDPAIVIVDGVDRHYPEKLGLHDLRSPREALRDGRMDEDVEFIIVSWDAEHLVTPEEPDYAARHADLVEYVGSTDAFREVRRFSTWGLPMVRVLERGHRPETPLLE